MAAEDFQITIKGVDELVRKFAAAGGNVPELMMRTVQNIQNTVANDAKSRHYFLGVAYKGSAEDEEAAAFVFTNPDGTPRFRVRTANLRNSIIPLQVKITGDTITGPVVAGMEYARDVEYGGPGRRAFPFMLPALEANRNGAYQTILALLREIAKGFKR